MNKNGRKKKSQYVVSEELLLKKIIDSVEQDPNTSSVQKGNLFTEWILKYMFERIDDDIQYDINIAGKWDNSIDAWFEDNDTLHIIQAKYNTSHTRDSYDKFTKDIERLLADPYNSIGENKNIKEFSETLSSYLKQDNNNDEDEECNKRIQIYYITSSKLTTDVKKIAVLDKKKIEESYQNVTLNVMGSKELKEYFLIALHELPSEYKKTPKKLILKKYFITGETCVAEVELKHFAKFVDDNLQYLFFSNIRNYLRNTKVNIKIGETFKNKPTDFWYYNNGITIICDDFDEKALENDVASQIPIFAPQIVNGCQTASKIHEEYNAIKDQVIKNNIQGCILVKIIKDKNLNKVNDIIKCTNNQNTVSAMDFFALEDFHKNFKIKFAELGYYYEIQRKEGQFEKRFDDVKFKKTYGPNSINKPYEYLFGNKFDYVLPVKKVVQAYVAGIHYMPGTSGSRAGQLAPGTTLSKTIFNDNTPTDPLYFLFPFAVMEYARKELGYGGTNNKNKDKDTSVIRRRTNTIDFRKNCLMLFISVYFKFVVRFLKELKYYNIHDNDEPLKVDLNFYNALFQDRDTNIMLLNQTDSILASYVDDMSVKAIYQENLPKFLKTDVQKNQTAKEIMVEKIQSTILDKLTNDEYLMFQQLADKCFVGNSET